MRVDLYRAVSPRIETAYLLTTLFDHVQPQTMSFLNEIRSLRAVHLLCDFNVRIKDYDDCR
jgi:hypothetical protein